jgi:hypothetical protein
MFHGNMKTLQGFVLTRFPRRTGVHFDWKRFSYGAPALAASHAPRTPPITVGFPV